MRENLIELDSDSEPLEIGFEDTTSFGDYNTCIIILYEKCASACLPFHHPKLQGSTAQYQLVWSSQASLLLAYKLTYTNACMILYLYMHPQI
jgi:predicted glycosyltransferase